MIWAQLKKGGREKGTKTMISSFEESRTNNRFVMETCLDSERRLTAVQVRMGSTDRASLEEAISNFFLFYVVKELGLSLTCGLTTTPMKFSEECFSILSLTQNDNSCEGDAECRHNASPHAQFYHSQADFRHTQI